MKPKGKVCWSDFDKWNSECDVSILILSYVALNVVVAVVIAVVVVVVVAFTHGVVIEDFAFNVIRKNETFLCSPRPKRSKRKESG